MSSTSRRSAKAGIVGASSGRPGRRGIPCCTIWMSSQSGWCQVRPWALCRGGDVGDVATGRAAVTARAVGFVQFLASSQLLWRTAGRGRASDEGDRRERRHRGSVQGRVTRRGPREPAGTPRAKVSRRRSGGQGSCGRPDHSPLPACLAAHETTAAATTKPMSRTVISIHTQPEAMTSAS